MSDLDSVNMLNINIMNTLIRNNNNFSKTSGKLKLKLEHLFAYETRKFNLSKSYRYSDIKLLSALHQDSYLLKLWINRVNYSRLFNSVLLSIRLSWSGNAVEHNQNNSPRIRGFNPFSRGALTENQLQ